MLTCLQASLRVQAHMSLLSYFKFFLGPGLIVFYYDINPRRKINDITVADQNMDALRVFH